MDRQRPAILPILGMDDVRLGLSRATAIYLWLISLSFLGQLLSLWRRHMGRRNLYLSINFRLGVFPPHTCVDIQYLYRSLDAGYLFHCVSGNKCHEYVG
jgi:hypothetical protein